MNRRDFIKAVGFGAAALPMPDLLLKAGENKDGPNFVIIIADDVGWNDVGAYGHPHIRTPNIDNLATQGLKFEQAFLTCASCSPTRCSIMTGRYPHSTGAGQLHQPLPADQVVFAGLLKQAGYHTVSAGKWHLGNAAKVNFDLVVSSRPSGCEKWVSELKACPKGKPFFMWFAAFDAHRPYKPNTIPNPHTPEDAVVPPFLPDVPETRQDLALYYDEISRLDNFIGKVVAELDRQGIADNTFVLFLSDNGRPFPRCKTTIYDSGTRTPFIVRWPRRVKPGTICENLVSVVDIAPTIIELVGLKASPTFQGKSFAKMLENPNESIRDYVFLEHNWHDYQAHERGVRSKQYLYIRNAFPELPGTPPADAVHSITYQTMQKLGAQGRLKPQQQGCFLTPRPEEELYDVKADPYSLNNLASEPRYRNILERMRLAHDNWTRRTDDSVPKNPTPDRFDRETGMRLKKKS